MDREIVTLNPPVWDTDQATRDRCAVEDHPPLTFNPMLDKTFCRCGKARYPGDVGRIDPESTTPADRAPWFGSPDIAPPELPPGLRIAIDEDCPRCGYPERFYDVDRQVFGCSSLNSTPCGYESAVRDA